MSPRRALLRSSSILFALMVSLWAAAPALADEPSACGDCHTTAYPTVDEGGLETCPSAETLPASIRRPALPRDVILLDMLSDPDDVSRHIDQFGPVPFDHQAHASWSEIGQGCVLCHHHSPSGETTPPCRECHEAKPSGTLNMPGLKGAYHRQCLGCHREWSHETRCVACHLSRQDDTGFDTGGADSVSVEMVQSLMTPPLEVPKHVVYPTAVPEPGASAVAFDHVRHVEQFDLQCVECHRGDTCDRCHEPEAARSPAAVVDKDPHAECVACHDPGDGCESCHRTPEQGPADRFDHAKTGFSLAPNHEDVSCRACHGDAPYEGRSQECAACHTDWEKGTFAHGQVTGLRLDPLHTAFTCDACHDGKRYATGPSCTPCHSADKKPDRLPGVFVSPRSDRPVRSRGE